MIQVFILYNQNISDLHLTLGLMPLIQCHSVCRNIADQWHWVRHRHFQNVRCQCHDHFPLPKIPRQMNISKSKSAGISSSRTLKYFIYVSN